MSVHGKVRVWRRTPEEVAAYLAGTGKLKLGKPDEIIDPVQAIVAPVGQNPQDYLMKKEVRLQRAIKSAKKGKPLINPMLYVKWRAEGKTHKQISEECGISVQTLSAYIGQWRKKGFIA